MILWVAREGLGLDMKICSFQHVEVFKEMYNISTGVNNDGKNLGMLFKVQFTDNIHITWESISYANLNYTH